MRLWICLFAMASALVAADQKSAATAPKTVRYKTAKPPAKPATKAAKAPGPQTVPADAVETGPGTWAWTDPQGKHWTYRKTPFGVSRFEGAAPKEADEENLRKQKELTTAADHGDSVVFERPGPFGVYRWERKKTELSEEEKAIWERKRIGQQESRKE